MYIVYFFVCVPIAIRMCDQSAQSTEKMHGVKTNGIFK